MKRVAFLLTLLTMCGQARAEIWLRHATADQRVPLGFFVDSTDGDTPETGEIASTDIKLWKKGEDSLANCSSGATHMDGGVYYVELNDDDTDTNGPLVIFIHKSGALPVRLECTVLPERVYDSLVNGVAQPRTWYLAASGGSDSNDGLTRAAPLATRAEAESRAQAGDTIWLLGEFGSESSGQPAYRATKDGVNLRGDGIGMTKLISDYAAGLIIEADDVTVSHLTAQGDPTPDPDEYGISITGERAIVHDVNASYGVDADFPVSLHDVLGNLNGDNTYVQPPFTETMDSLRDFLWEAPTTDMSYTGGIGFLLKNYVDVAISSRLAPTDEGRTLDVTTNGAAGIDWGNIENQSSSANLSDTTVATSTSISNVGGVNATTWMEGLLNDAIVLGGLSVEDFSEQAAPLLIANGMASNYAAGRVWIDTLNGTDDDTPYLFGTINEPVDNIIDAFTVAAAVKVSDFNVANGSTIELASASTAKNFIGNEWTVELNGQDVSGSYFHGAHVSQEGLGTSSVFDHCTFGEVELPPTVISSSAFAGEFVASGAGQFTIVDGHAAADDAAPLFNFSEVSGATKADFRKWSGGIEIEIKEGVTINLDMIAGGIVTLTGNGGSGAGATININGKTRSVVDNTTGNVTVNQDGRD
ncbi:MAG: hypothetical protein WD669_04210 [Pirellulales bacterium]